MGHGGLSPHSRCTGRERCGWHTRPDPALARSDALVSLTWAAGTAFCTRLLWQSRNPATSARAAEPLIALPGVLGSWQGFWKGWLSFSILICWHGKDGAIAMQGQVFRQGKCPGFYGSAANRCCKTGMLGEHWSAGRPLPGWDEDEELRPCLPPGFPRRARGRTLAARTRPLNTSKSQPAAARAPGGTARGQGGKRGMVYFGHKRKK